MEFRAKVKVDIGMGREKQGLGDIDSVEDMYVKWEISFEMREYGIKDVYISVPMQELKVRGVHLLENPNDPNDEELYEHDFEIDLSNAVINTDFGFDRNNTCYPTDLLLEYSEGQQRWVGTLS